MAGPIAVLPGATGSLRSPMLDFTLENLTVQVGDTITWENEDAAPHTSTSGVSPDTDGIWDSPAMNTGGLLQFHF